MITSLVLTVLGDDRPGIVNRLSETAQRFQANWALSHMASVAGQFAGIAHLEVEDVQAELLTAALRELEAVGLRVVIARGAHKAAAAAWRRVRLELVGHDRPGIIRELSASLVALGVSIDEMHTHVASAAMSGDQLFKVRTLLAVPNGVANDALRRALEALANEMMVDFDTGESA